MTEATETALVVEVPAAEPIVAHWRQEFDHSAADGMPAHVTVLYPFRAADAVDAAVLARLGEVIAAVPAFDVVFAAPARFSDVLWVRPDPEEPFRELTRRLWTAFPDCPPYGGMHDEPQPHLTVAHGADEILRPIGVELADALAAEPVRERVETVSYMEQREGGRWVLAAALPLG